MEDRVECSSVQLRGLYTLSGADSNTGICQNIFYFTAHIIGSQFVQNMMR